MQKRKYYRIDYKFAGIPTGVLRIGNFDRFYFSASYGQNLPLFSGGGFYDLGIGFGLGEPGKNLWLGVGSFPYEGTMLSAKGSFPFSEKFIFEPRLQLGGSELFQYGLSLNGKMRF